MDAFKAYDIRGRYPGDWSGNDVYKIGYFLPKLLNTKEILVGRDARLTSDEIYIHLSRGIRDAGASVLNMGLSTTPMVYWATSHLGLKASVQITASHNPAEYNGLKVSAADAMPVGYENGLNKIHRWMGEKDIIRSANPGSMENIDLGDEYLAFMRTHAALPAGLKIAVDCSNGMAGLFIRDLLGKSQIFINEEPDGRFPGHDPNPLNPENIIQLSQTVRDNGCHLGLIFDGDGDRVMFVDENGSFISPDLMIAVLGHKFLDGKTDYRVLQDIRTSKSVGEYLENMGAEMHMWRVGRAFATPKLKEIDGIYGGELAGHYYFRDFNYSDSGILASLFILDVISAMQAKGRTLSSLIASISNYCSSGEINFIVEDKNTAILTLVESISASEKVLKKYDFDGYRLEFNDWWFNIRPSNTEPYLRFIAEAGDEGLLKDKIAMVKRLLGPFIDHQQS